MEPEVLPSGAVRVRARAKINLTLQVGAPLPAGEPNPGYHLLDSLIAFAQDAADWIEVSPAADLRLAVTGPQATALDGPAGENLVLRAARALQAATGIDAGAAITLTKTLPVASGIGGGSADAAATLLALSELWAVAPSVDLSAIAATLGADVPACLAGQPARMLGIGADLSPVALPELVAVLINPGVGCATPAVYRAFDQRLDAGQQEPGVLGQPLPALATPRDVWALIRPGANSLEDAAITLVPEIGLVLDVLRDAAGTRAAAMSGSGATCFGLFDTLDQAHNVAALVSRLLGDALPGLWVQATRLG